MTKVGMQLCMCLVMAAGLQQPVLAAEMADEDAKKQAPVQIPEKKPGLRFKRGPTCMCAHGMSEQEIQEAEEKRRTTEKRQQH